MKKKSQGVTKAVAAGLVLVVSAMGGLSYAQTLASSDPDDNPPPLGSPVECDETPYCVIKIDVRDCNTVSVDKSYVRVRFTRPIRFEIGVGAGQYELATYLNDGTGASLDIPGILFYAPGKGKFKRKAGADQDPNKTATIENVDTTFDTLLATRQKKFQYGVYVKEAGAGGRACTPLDPWIRNY